MSTIREEFARIRLQLDDCFAAVSEKGVTPATEYTLLNLAANIRAISQCGSGGGTTVIVDGDKRDVELGNGIYNNETKLITWTCGDGAITIVQSKGTGTTVVNQTFISAPRLYKGHILSFECIDGVVIDEIQVKYSSQYKGYNLVLGTSLDENGDVIANTTDCSIEEDTMTDGTHVITANALPLLYLQNVSDSSNVQLRITDLHITYHATT